MRLNSKLVSSSHRGRCYRPSHEGASGNDEIEIQAEWDGPARYGLSSLQSVWYATITARSDGKDAGPIIAIAGPFADLEQAKAHNGQCMELSRRNRQFYLVDMPSVPADGSLADVCRDLTKG